MRGYAGGFGLRPAGGSVLRRASACAPDSRYADQIASVTRDALLAFRKKHYRPDNTVLAIAGQFDTEKFRELAEKLLGGWHAEGETHIPGAGKRHDTACFDAEKGHRAGSYVSGIPGRAAG